MTRDEFISAAMTAEIDACIVWPFASRASSGYGAHSFRADGVKINVDAHRHVCSLAHGAAPPHRPQAAHKCGNKLCINPRHLKWASAVENMADAKRHGTLKGGGRFRQRIFPADIERICRSDKSLLALAAEYRSDPAYIGKLKRAHAHG